MIIETKNYTGTIEYDDDSGMLLLRRDNGRVERFDDPLIQVNIQRNQLQRLLAKRNYSSIPFHTHQDGNAHFAALYEYNKIFEDEITNTSNTKFFAN